MELTRCHHGKIGSCDVCSTPPGPTGEFPYGKMNKDDAGELAVAFRIDEETNRLVMHFGISVTWIGLTKEKAMELSAVMAVLAGKMR